MDKVNVEYIVSCSEGEKEGENVEIETVERNSSCGEYGDDLCLPSSNVKEEDATVSIGGMRWHNKVNYKEILEHVKITTVREGVLTTVSELRFPKDEVEDLDEGSVHKLPSEVLTEGQTVLVAGERKDKIVEERKVS